MKDITSCYKLGLKEDSQLSGRFVVSFKINSKERVKSLSIVESTLHSKIIGSCAVSRFSAWQFPLRVGGEEVTVEYPLR